MDTKVYVGNLSYNTSESGLEQAFAQAGTVVSAQIITHRDSGRSKGFGFVEFETPEEAQAAIEMWHEKELDGRPLIVNIARPKAPRNDSFGGGGGGGFSRY